MPREPECAMQCPRVNVDSREPAALGMFSSQVSELCCCFLLQNDPQVSCLIKKGEVVNGQILAMGSGKTWLPGHSPTVSLQALGTSGKHRPDLAFDVVSGPLKKGK